MAFVVLLLFGGSRVSSLGRGLGEAVRNFRDGLRGGDAERDHPAKRDV